LSLYDTDTSKAFSWTATKPPPVLLSFDVDAPAALEEEEVVDDVLIML
jgi:hypothetical protein